MRTIINIPDSQIEILQKLCDRVGESRAQIICKAIEEYVSKHCVEHDECAFGIWKDKPETSFVYQSKLRSEWERT